MKSRKEKATHDRPLAKSKTSLEMRSAIPRAPHGLDKTISNPEFAKSILGIYRPTKHSFRRKSDLSRSFYYDDGAAPCRQVASDLELVVSKEQQRKASSNAYESATLCRVSGDVMTMRPAGDNAKVAKLKRKSKIAIPAKGDEQQPQVLAEKLTKKSVIYQLKDAEAESRKTGHIVEELRERLKELQLKKNIGETDASEIAEKNQLLRRELARFERTVRRVQSIVDRQTAETGSLQTKTLQLGDQEKTEGGREMQDVDEGVGVGCATLEDRARGGQLRSLSDIDLTRKLNESYDMQERLAADNADLEGNRYYLHKQLLIKDQALETQQAQMKTLQGEIKIILKENAFLQEKIDECNTQECKADDAGNGEEERKRLIEYNETTRHLEAELGKLGGELQDLQMEMDSMRSRHACRSAGGRSCIDPSADGYPAHKKECGLCPPCPASCNPNAAPALSLDFMLLELRQKLQTPAEKEVSRLQVQLQQLTEEFKTKVTEVGILRAESVRRKEDAERERSGRQEAEHRLRELELKFEGLAKHTTQMLGTKEQMLEQEQNVQTLKQCYRDARDEIEELRTLLKEQNEQLQDYRVKYLQAQQTVEEQRRHIDMMDMDNTRISEQINLEIQRVKFDKTKVKYVKLATDIRRFRSIANFTSLMLKFQEKLQELAPLPDILNNTQAKLKEAQQLQMLAEHNAESLARELHACREKVHILMNNSKNQEKSDKTINFDEKSTQLMQQKMQSLQDQNSSLKAELERLRNNVIRLEEAQIQTEKRLQEKMNECAALGGELDAVREDSARAVARARDRTETVKKCLQSHIAELERQVAASRAQARTAQKDRDELRRRMQCQISSLNESFDQAQLRIKGLQGQVNSLKKSISTVIVGDAGETDMCGCHTTMQL